MKPITRYRFFGGLLETQSRFLNRMAARGYRLTDTGRLRYTFVPDTPGARQYCVEYVGDLSRTAAVEYRAFLESTGCRVWIKPINLNWSFGKVTLRPTADAGARIATTATTYGRELFIVEKASDGHPFALHTTLEDRIAYTRRLRRPALGLCTVALLLALLWRMWGWLLVAAAAAVPLCAVQLELYRLGREAKTRE